MRFLVVLALLLAVSVTPTLAQGNGNGNGNGNGQSENGNGNGNGNGGSNGNAGGNSGNNNSGNNGNGNGNGGNTGGEESPSNSGDSNGNGQGPIRAPIEVSPPAPQPIIGYSEDEARDELSAGRTVTLGSLLPDVVARTGGGEMVDAQLLRVQGLLVYAVKVLRGDGRVTTEYYYAQSGVFIGSEP